jgi:RNA polymerase sigma-70 factor (ECF subfamily)
MAIKLDLIIQDSDKELIKRFQLGDADAFDQLFVRYEKPLLNFLYRFTGDYQLAEDVFQEAFFAVYKKAQKFDLSKKFSTWLHEIAVNKAVDKLRKKRVVLPLKTEIESIEHDRISPEEDFEKREIQTRLQKALGFLSEEHRLVLVLKHYQGLDYKEIGEILDCPVGTVKSRVYYALKDLKNYLEK